MEDATTEGPLSSGVEGASFRHFVASKCREAGLSYQASAYWQGHDPAGSGHMRDVYDNPEDTFEEQGRRLPHGPIGLLEPPQVSLASDLPAEVEALLRDFMTGRLGSVELLQHLERARRESVDATILKP